MSKIHNKTKYLSICKHQFFIVKQKCMNNTFICINNLCM